MDEKLEQPRSLCSDDCGYWLNRNGCEKCPFNKEVQPAEGEPCPFERIRDYPGCFEDCPDTDACPRKRKQPPEGELAPIPNKYNAQFDYDRWAAFDEGRQAQLAHTKAQGWHPPSECPQKPMPDFTAVEKQHILRALEEHYNPQENEWCTVCDEIKRKLG